MENRTHSDKRNMVKNKIRHFTINRTHNSNVDKTGFQHPQPLRTFQLTLRETRVTFSAVTQSISPLLFAFRSKYTFLGLLCYTSSSGKSEDIRTEDVGGQNHFQVIVSEKFLRHYKMFRLNDKHGHPAQSSIEVPIRNRPAQIKD
jgi:hypothetical protein